MVKTRNTGGKSGSEYQSTAAPEEKTKTIMLDHDLSPLVCRKLKFDTTRKGSLTQNTIKAVLSHKLNKSSVKFVVDWDSDTSEVISPSTISLQSAKKYCPDLLIDYLISKLRA